MVQKFLFFLIVNLLCSAAAELIIKEIVAPSSIELGKEEEVVLDCVYEAKDEKDVVVKWFYNGEIEQIYQWIPDANPHGFPSGTLKDNIDKEYKVSEGNQTLFRAIKIVNINPRMTGNYTCKVSSQTDEDKEVHQLVIYSPAKDGLKMILLPDDQMVVCSVSGIYPLPKIEIYISGDNNTIDFEEEETIDIDDEGYFNVTSMLTFEGTNLTGAVTKFICDMTIPGTDYFLTEEMEFYHAGDNPSENMSNAEADYIMILTNESFVYDTHREKKKKVSFLYDDTRENDNFTKNADSKGVTLTTTSALTAIFLVLTPLLLS